MNYTIIYNGVIINDNAKYLGYLLFDEDGTITSIRHGVPSRELVENCYDSFDASGCLVLPGVIDDQVHFRDPGLTHKGDIATESQAAAAGGVTSFMDMPNTKPPTVSHKAFLEKLQRGHDVSAVNYAFFMGATNDNLATLLTTDFSRCPGVKLFLGSSTGNMLVDRDRSLNEIFSRVPTIIAVHSEDESTIRANSQRISAQYPNGVPVEQHPNIRSRKACVISTRKAIDRAKKYGSRLHVLHLSTKEEAQMFSARPLSQKRITSEVCVHHLWFCDEDYSRLGTRIKMNPAIKTAADRDALRKALCDGRIDIVATDHAPHLLSEKDGDALTATSGAPMVQFSLPVMLEMADMGIFTHELVIEKMCHAPARLFGIKKRGYLRKGYAADITVVRTNDPYEVTDNIVLSHCGWTPLAGTTLHNRVIATWVNGKAVWRDGHINPEVRGKALRFNK